MKTDEGDYIDYGETVSLAPPADILKGLAYKDSEMPKGLTSAAQAFFLRARTLYHSPVDADRGKREMKELEQQYYIDRGNEQQAQQHAKMWAKIEVPATTYSITPTVENADLFYAAVYGLPNDWRLKRDEKHEPV